MGGYGHLAEEGGGVAGTGEGLVETLRDADGAPQRQPENAEAIGHADAEMDRERGRRHEPAVVTRRRNDVRLVEKADTIARGHGLFSSRHAAPPELGFIATTWGSLAGLGRDRKVRWGRSLRPRPQRAMVTESAAARVAAPPGPGGRRAADPVPSRSPPVFCRVLRALCGIAGAIRMGARVPALDRIGEQIFRADRLLGTIGLQH